MIKSLLASLLLLSISLTAAADNSYNNPVIRKTDTHQFMVSAMLRKNDQEATVKLVQSIEKALSKDEANGILLSRVKRDFQGYSVLDTLVTPVNESKDGCETWL